MSTPNEPSAQFQSIDPDSMRVDAIKFKAGTLFLGPPMRFEGEAEESAKVFFNHVVYIHSAEIREIQAKCDELQKKLDASEMTHREYVHKVNKGAPFPAELKAQSDALVKYANSNPTVLSLLYDLNLLPEQLEEGSFRWVEMMQVIIHFQIAEAQSKSTAP